MIFKSSAIMTSTNAVIYSISIVVFAVLVTVHAADSEDQAPHHREKRHVLQMCELIATHTNRGCLDYNNYGCFCGLGNAASRHVDAVDGCCRVHDRCYGDVSCFWIYPQFVGYSVNCNEAECTCTDSPIFSSCAYTTCQCDLQFAQCLARAEYNHAFSNFDRRECNRPRGFLQRTSKKKKRSAKKQWRELRRKEKSRRKRSRRALRRQRRKSKENKKKA